MTTPALYLAALALRPSEGDVTDYIRVRQRAIYEAHPASFASLGTNRSFYAAIRSLAEQAPEAIKVAPAVNGVDTSVYIVRPDVRFDVWAAIFPGLTLDDLIESAAEEYDLAR